jgi:hypothetical protein
LAVEVDGTSHSETPPPLLLLLPNASEADGAAQSETGAASKDAKAEGRDDEDQGAEEAAVELTAAV